MNRDAYSAILGKVKDFVQVPVKQMDNSIFKEKMHDESFRGIAGRRLIFMTNMGGVDATKGPRLKHDIIISNMEQLRKIHKPHFQYQLVPLKCESPAAFAAMQGVCSSPGSPFKMEHRLDPLELKMHFPHATFKPSPVLHVLEKFCVQEAFMSQDELRKPVKDRHYPLTKIEFGGAMVTPDQKTAATVVVRPVMSEKCINEAYLMQRFLFSDTFAKSECPPPNVPLFHLLQKAKNRFNFLASEQPIPAATRASMIQKAQKLGVFLYEQTERDWYSFVQK